MLFYVFLSEGKHLLMINIQLTFERVSVTLCRRVELMVMELMVMDIAPIRH